VTTDPYHLRTLETVDEWSIVSTILSDAFGDDMGAEDDERERLVFEPARDHVIEHTEDGGVANAAAYSRELTVPGGTVPAAHVSLVGVRQTHRRRGLLTRLMLHQLGAVRSAGQEPVAVLWASEGRIYQRFGYGLAAGRQVYEIKNREVRLARSVTPEVGRVRDTPPEQARKELQQVYERVRPTRPGWSSRDENWWSNRLLDPKASRPSGHTAMRALLFHGPEGVDGYALWRRKSGSDAFGPDDEVSVGEAVAATPEAYTALWQFLFSIDLSRTIRFRMAAVDEPLRYLVDEPRALRATHTDSLWLRIVDLPAALTARRYAAPVDLVVEVTDGLLPDNAGRWRLTADGSGATCTRTADSPDLTGDTTDLGAAYLGGTPLGALAGSGRVRELTPGALAVAAAAFTWHQAPSAIEVF